MSTHVQINNSDVTQNRDIKWKWIIALSCSWINAFIFGVFRSAGVLYGEFVDEFHCSYGEASWPISLAGSMASITGIFAGFLTHYFEIRNLVFVGVLICSIAISISYLATSLIHIIISLGLIQGIGIGLVTNLLPAIISEYFGKQRAIACGISYAGATTGAFIFPLFIEWQLKHYGLYETLLLMGGITLHGLIGALLLRPSNKRPDNLINENQKYANYETSGRNNIEPLIEECETVVFLRQNIDYNHQYVNINKLRERPKSMIDFDNPVVKLRDKTHLSIEKCRTNRMSLPVFSEKRVIRELNQSLANQPSNSCLAIKTSPPKIKYSLIDSIRKNIKQDLKLLFNIHFELCSLTYLCFIINFVALLIVLPNFATDRGLTPHEGTLLLSLFSITDLLGRLIPGWVSYLGLISNKHIYIISIGVFGVCFLLFPFVNSFLGFTILTLVCGFVTGCQMVLPAVVLSEFLGTDKTAIAFGLSNFICGSVTMIVRPLLIGVKDGTGQFDLLFYILGILAISSALLWILDCFRTRSFGQTI